MTFPLLPAAAPPPPLIAASPLPSEAFAMPGGPFIAPLDLPGFLPAGESNPPLPLDTLPSTVETFDPAARAEQIAAGMPRSWSGDYQPFDRAGSVPVSLTLDAVSARGQIVVLEGRMTIDGRETPVQGNINAKSDQLDLLLLADELGAGLEPGGEFQGLQGLNLSGWRASRLTVSGGRLQLTPGPAAPMVTPSGVPIRGLW